MVHQRPHQNQRMGGGAADAAAALVATLVECTVGVGSGYHLDAVFPALSALPSADFFPVPPGLGLANGAAVSDNGGGTADA